jgi:hypothetical protein
MSSSLTYLDGRSYTNPFGVVSFDSGKMTDTDGKDYIYDATDGDIWIQKDPPQWSKRYTIQNDTIYDDTYIFYLN